MLTKEQASAGLANLVLENDGNFPANTDKNLVLAIAQHGLTVGTGAYDISRMMAWTEKVKAAELAAASAFNRTPCPITEAEFAEQAPLLEVTVGGTRLNVIKKYGAPRKSKDGKRLTGGAFKSGAFGYWVTGNFTKEIAGKPVKFQISTGIVAVNSGKGDDAPADES